MIVVSNTSPIINLAAIGQLDLLKKLYDTIFIPHAVYHEITVKGQGQIGALEIEKSSWITVKQLLDKNLGEALKLELDEGEAEAIVLAIGLQANLLLIDERAGRKVADHFGVRYIGLLGVIIEAKQKKLIPKVKPVLDDLISKAGFWINLNLYNRVLQAAGESETD